MPALSTLGPHYDGSGGASPICERWLGGNSVHGVLNTAVSSVALAACRHTDHVWSPTIPSEVTAPTSRGALFGTHWCLPNSARYRSGTLAGVRARARAHWDGACPTRRDSPSFLTRHVTGPRQRRRVPGRLDVLGCYPRLSPFATHPGAGHRQGHKTTCNFGGPGFRVPASVPPAGVEPATWWVEATRSVQLSYGGWCGRKTSPDDRSARTQR